MATAQTDSSALFSAYRREFLTARLPGYARLGVGVAFGINTAFMALDYVSFPEQFRLFLALRLGLSALFGGIYFASDRFPRASAWSICLSLGAAMLAMIFATGGSESRYFAGLMLLFLGMGVVLPLSGREAAGICGVILVPFLAAPGFEAGPVDWSIFRMNAVFLLSAAAESVASCIYLERMRFKDFQQRRELQQARDHLEEMDRAKSRFTANIHHELRTPLTLTLAPIEGLLAGEFGDISALQRQYMKTAETNAIRLLKLINNLLDLAKLESQQLELRRSTLDPVRLTEDLIDGARPLAERKGIELAVRCSSDVPLIQADSDAFEKVLVNMLGNALKFTDSGGRIGVELESGGAQGGLSLRVVDSGIGIPQEQLEHIFDRFAQVDASSTRKHEGTGIGLSLCHELVELHGGRIWAESDGPGHGTRMCVWLPAGEASSEVDECVLETPDGHVLTAGRSLDSLETEMDLEHREVDGYQLSDVERSVDRHESAAGFEQQPEDVDGPDSSLPEIVVADDNADMRSLLHHLLGREFRVRLARNGREALESVRERAPDVVLTDVMMPEMSGTELCQALKESPETSRIPVVLVTSKAERAMKIEGLELGADDYITKPFHARELLARIRSLVRVRQLQAEVEERNKHLEAANLRVESALTELKETQVQLVSNERMAAIGELAAGVAHEANNPLNFAANAMRSLTGSLGDIEDVVHEIVGLGSCDPSEAHVHLEKLRQLCTERDFDCSADLLRELAGIIEEGIERTSRLVGNLRDFARPGAAHEETVDLQAGIQSALQLMSFALRDAGISIELEADAELPLLRGDARALNQVFLNLLKNATDAMAGRRGVIHIALLKQSDCVAVRIRDEGPGIPDKMRKALFEPFCTTKGAGKGTGLGLSISRRILHEHGGSLEVFESSERGSTFELRLPLPDDD